MIQLSCKRDQLQFNHPATARGMTTPQGRRRAGPKESHLARHVWASTDAQALHGSSILPEGGHVKPNEM